MEDHLNKLWNMDIIVDIYEGLHIIYYFFFPFLTGPGFPLILYHLYGFCNVGPDWPD